MSQTKAQLVALRLAKCEPIRYYKGGWYSIPSLAGDNQALHEFGMRLIPSTNSGTLRACVARGWLVEGDDGDAWERPIIYSARWTLTDLGRAAIDAAKGTDR